jgi:hypothetical protein
MYMSANDEKLVSLREVEGKLSPHQAQLDRALNARAEALNFVEDASALAEFIGGNSVVIGRREDWAIRKELFPGVVVYYVFSRSDDEFPASLKALFTGDRLDLMSGEDLAGFVIPTVSHMLRYVRLSYPDKELPEVCYRM